MYRKTSLINSLFFLQLFNVFIIFSKVTLSSPFGFGCMIKKLLSPAARRQNGGLFAERFKDPACQVFLHTPIFKGCGVANLFYRFVPCFVTEKSARPYPGYTTHKQFNFSTIQQINFSTPQHHTYPIPFAFSRSSSRNWGSAMLMSARVRSFTVSPVRRATPCSVTT